ncbi:MAG: amidohydrolase [Atopobiaceae bacterium]
MPEPTTDLLRKYRRDLHRIPEVDFDLPQTLAYVHSVLDPLAQTDERISVFEPCRSTVCLLVDRGTPAATAIRSDMDALPVTERTGVPFASQHPGRMHACGHDGHMAMVLGLAQHLALHVDELPRSVLLVFQPAEETTGGAKVVCQTGVFDRLGVDRIFGFHLWPDLPAGQVASRPGGLLAASNETTVDFTGKASHIAKPREGRDAIEAAALFLLDAYGMMDQRKTEEPCLLKFGRIEGGQVRNQIAASARLEGSLRTFSLQMGKRCRADIERLAHLDAQAVGCQASVHFSEGYPPVVNDEALYAQVAAVLPQLRTLDEPLLIAEDFAWYQQYLPGVFLLLGTGTGIALHSDTFDFDEEVLMEGVRTYERLVMMA